MLEKSVEYFYQYMGKGDDCEVVSKGMLNKYKGEFLTDKDKDDIINYLWNKNGFCGYKGGLFWLVNPDVYTEIARKFPDVSSTSIAFARSATGGIFLWDRMKIGDSILYLNVHKGETQIVSTSFEVFITFSIPADSFWKRECYGNVELKAIKKYGPINKDECLAFVPALVLGGEENIKNMEKVKIIPHLELLAQLYG